MKLSTAMVYMGGSAALLSTSQGGWIGCGSCLDCCFDSDGNCCMEVECTCWNGLAPTYSPYHVMVESGGSGPGINFYQQARNANAGARSAEEEVPICANLNITDINTCGNYCDDNSYGNGTASWDIQGNVNGPDTSCVCYSTEDLTPTTVCTTHGNVPVMAPAPIGSIPSCISLKITSSDECEHACYPEGGLITGVSFSNGFCQCGVFDNMPSFILCEDATPTASPTSNADVTSSVLAGCFALAAMITHIL